MSTSRAKGKKTVARKPSRRMPSPSPSSSSSGTGSTDSLFELPPEEQGMEEELGQEAGEYDHFWFRSSAMANRWHNYHGKRVERGKNVQFNDFARFKIYQRFNLLGWAPLLTLDLDCYPLLVQYFYCNLTEHQLGYPDYSICSRVKGVDIEITISLMARILGIPDSGELYYVIPRTDPVGPLLDRDQYTQMYMDLSQTGSHPLTEADYHPSARLISRIVQYNLCPKAGHRTELGYLGAFVTHCIYKASVGGRVPNLPYLMMRCMGYHAMHPDDGNLPFGRLLSRIFMFFGISTHGEAPGGAGPRPLGRTSLKKMGMEDTPGSDEEAPAPPPAPAAPAPRARQTRSSHRAPPPSVASTSRTPPPMPVPPAPTTEYSLGDVMSRLQAMDTRFETMMQTMQQGFSGIQLGMDAMGMRVGVIERRLDAYDDVMGIDSRQDDDSDD